MKLYIDSREPKQIINLIANYNNNAKEQFEIIIKSLDLGDYLIENEDKSLILFERKSLADLEASIKDGRYSEQSYRLNECAIANHNIIYLIEGSIINYKNKYFVNSLYSSLLTLNYFKGFSVLNSINIIESAEIIYRFANKLLNSFSSKNNFIVLLVRLFFSMKPSSTLQMTSTIAFPIPKIFILSFFGNNRFFSIWVASSAYFTA